MRRLPLKRQKLSAFLRDERGLAGTELALMMPTLALIIFGLIGFGVTIYTHLAVLTAAADCAFNGAQATNGGRMDDQGTAAQTNALASFSVPQEVLQGRVYRRGESAGRGRSTMESATCQAGYPTRDWGVSILLGGVWGSRAITIQYTLKAPAQPFKSNWQDDGAADYRFAGP